MAKTTSRPDVVTINQTTLLALTMTLLLIVLGGLTACGAVSGFVEEAISATATAQVAENGTGGSDGSSGVTQGGALPPPSGFNAALSLPDPLPADLSFLENNFTLRLGWADNANNETGYIVRRGIGNATPGGSPIGVAEIVRTPADANGVQDKPVNCGTTYIYYVSAYNIDGTSDAVCIQVTMPLCGQPDLTLGVAGCDAIPGVSIDRTGQASTTTTGGTTGGDSGSTSGGSSSTGGSTGDASQVDNATPATRRPPPATCGDSICDPNSGENTITCPADCTSSCGDGVCDPQTENYGSCPADCASTCGDGTCDLQTENYYSCTSDCTNVCGDYVCDPTESSAVCADCYCGDGICDGAEDGNSCPADCTAVAQPPQSSCGDGICGPDEDYKKCNSDCEGYSGDGVCDFTETAATSVDCWCGDNYCDPSESKNTCSKDCGAPPPQSSCGDNVCEGNENVNNCSQDCAVCGDGFCEGHENANNCSKDCYVAFGTCGNGTCESTEDAANCPQDCSLSGDVCGDGQCTGDENALNCSQDCGSGSSSSGGSSGGPCGPSDECDSNDDCSNGQYCGADTCTCVGAICGDGVKEVEEQCDGSDGPCDDGYACGSDCLCHQIAQCGNGNIEPGEQCEVQDDCPKPDPDKYDYFCSGSCQCVLIP